MYIRFVCSKIIIWYFGRDWVTGRRDILTMNKNTIFAVQRAIHLLVCLARECADITECETTDIIPIYFRTGPCCMKQDFWPNWLVVNKQYGTASRGLQEDSSFYYVFLSLTLSGWWWALVSDEATVYYSYSCTDWKLDWSLGRVYVIDEWSLLHHDI